MSVGYNDKKDRDWGRHFLIKTKGRKTVYNGVNTYGDTRDIKDTESTYGADVEHAQLYNPLTRNRPISIPYRKSKVGKYWNNKETDYIQYVGMNNTKLIYIKSNVINSYKDNPIQRGNLPWKRDSTWKGYTKEECQKIFNTYIEIPKDRVEIWNRIGKGPESTWEKIN